MIFGLLIIMGVGIISIWDSSDVDLHFVVHTKVCPDFYHIQNTKSAIWYSMINMKKQKGNQSS